MNLAPNPNPAAQALGIWKEEQLEYWQEGMDNRLGSLVCLGKCVQGLGVGSVAMASHLV